MPPLPLHPVGTHAHMHPLGTIEAVCSRSMRPAAKGLAALRRGNGVFNNIGALVPFGANTSSARCAGTFRFARPSGASRGRLWCGASGRM